MAGAREARGGVTLLASGSGARRLPARPGPYPPGNPFDARRADRDRRRDGLLCEPLQRTATAVRAGGGRRLAPRAPDRSDGAGTGDPGRAALRLDQTAAAGPDRRAPGP